MKALCLSVVLLVAGALPDAAQPSPPAGAAQPSSPAGATEPPRKLVPRYPATRDCSPITSLFGSYDDVDGEKRGQPHSGIDLGRLDETIIAPADGTVVAAWRANWGWGEEGALLIRHRKQDLGFVYGPDFYYSEFDHLRYEEIAGLAAGRRFRRGEALAHVSRPGGNPDYFPEVHWEIWSIADEAETVWSTNEYGANAWRNATGRLVDPLYLLSLNTPVPADGSATIVPFEPRRNYRGFRGFTYILPCPRTPGRR